MPAKLPEPDLAALFDAHVAEGNLDTFMANALDRCVEWFGALRVSLFLRNDFSGDYLLSGQAGAHSDVPQDTALRSGHGIAGKAIELGKPQLVQDDLHNAKRPSLVASALVVPLCTAESGCIGVLNVSRDSHEAQFTQDDLGRADTIGRYLGLAINNARLFARMNHAVGQSRALSDKLDAIIACLGIGVLVVSEFEEITGWNPEARSLFGESLGPGVLLRHVLKGMPMVLRLAVEQTFVNATDGHRSARRAFDSASDRAWSIIASPLPAGGATLAIQDITEQERAQRELSRVRRLAEIGQMTAAVAHEIRNPLTGIRSAAQMVQGVSEEACEYGKIIEEEALKLNALCDEFLEFARPLALNLREFEPADAVRRICDQHRPDFEKANVALILTVRSEPPPIKGDPMRLEQVIRNLVLDALQACRTGGTVTVTVDHGVISVADTGVGIEPHMLDKVFTPFFTTKPNGTGLGLSTVRKIVDAHGWDVRVQSTVGSGTLFEIDLELEKVAA